MSSIQDVSQDELAAIAKYLAGKHDGRPSILVGGWAVHAYNPYEKSRDVDLVLGSKRRGRLLQWLRDERHYEKMVEHVHGWSGANKNFTGIGAMIVDVAGYDEHFPFYGRKEELNFDLAGKHHVERDIAGNPLLVPTRSLLMLYKAKAAWDRAGRLAANDSRDPDWERGKLNKDRSDILAILDSNPTAPDWEIAFLGKELKRLPFLGDVLSAAAADPDAVQRYRKLSPKDAKARMDEFLSLVK